MGIDFEVKDILHKITAKFRHAFLPEAKKPYNLHAVHQPELDIHGVASKADVYNLAISPKIIEEGTMAFMKLCYYLTADGYRIKTPLFTLRMRIPGEYNGSETHLPHDVFPAARLQTNVQFQNYLKDHVEIVIDGIDQAEGYIAEVTDEATGLIDQVITRGNLITIGGWGMKIDGEEEYEDDIGLYFMRISPNGPPSFKAEIIAVNEPRTIKAIVPPGLVAGETYALKIVTQTSARHGSAILKKIRELDSDIHLQAR